jgi:hypothetical protein
VTYRRRWSTRLTAATSDHGNSGEVPADRPGDGGDGTTLDAARASSRRAGMRIRRKGKKCGSWSPRTHSNSASKSATKDTGLAINASQPGQHRAAHPTTWRVRARRADRRGGGHCCLRTEIVEDLHHCSVPTQTPAGSIRRSYRAQNIDRTAPVRQSVGRRRVRLVKALAGT